MLVFRFHGHCWRILAAAFMFAVAIQAVPPAVAEALPEPMDEVILTVSGRITHGNGRTADGQNEARFDRAMLLRLGITEFETETPWHSGQVRFEGVLIRRLLAAVGAQGRSLYARAHNDYSVELPVDDVERYDVILALRANGRDLRLRDKGPVFIIYPYSTDIALRSDMIYSRSVWQLRRLEVR